MKQNMVAIPANTDPAMLLPKLEHICFPKIGKSLKAMLSHVQDVHMHLPLRTTEFADFSAAEEHVSNVRTTFFI